MSKTKKYRVVWRIELEKTFFAKDVEDAIVVVENVDCQHDGEYVSDSFEIVKVEEV